MTPLANLASIAEHGLLSHQRVAQLQHASVAMAEVQDLRSGRTVPGGRPLHEYVNLYFDARNAMMFLRRARNLVVVRVAPAVLDLPGVVVTDGNAANGPTRFLPSPSGRNRSARGSDRPRCSSPMSYRRSTQWGATPGTRPKRNSAF